MCGNKWQRYIYQGQLKNNTRKTKIRKRCVQQKRRKIKLSDD